MTGSEKKLPGALTPDNLFSNPFVARYEAEIRALQNNRPWQSAKANDVELLSFFPPEYCIQQSVFCKEDKSDIQDAMLGTLEQGFLVGFRTCPLNPEMGKAKWLMGLKTPAQVDAFLNSGEQVWTTSSTNPLKSYSELLNDPNTAEVIVLANPPGLESKELDNQRFVAGVFFSASNKLAIEVLPHTSRLRDFSRITPLVVEMDLGETIFSFQKGQIAVSSPCRDYFLPESEVLKPEFAELIEQIKEVVFEKLWSFPFHLPYRLKALNNAADISVLEFQGLFREEEFKHFLLYGFK